MNNPLATLTDRFLKERTYLKNVTPATLRWYRIAFKNYEASFAGEAPLPSKTALQDFVVAQRERGIRAVTVRCSSSRCTRSARAFSTSTSLLRIAVAILSAAERNLHRILPAPRRHALHQPRTRTSVHPKRIAPGRVCRTHRHRRRTRLWDAELRVIVRISRMQRLGGEDRVPLSNFYFHACVRAKAGSEVSE
jgi:hypothetical protein